MGMGPNPMATVLIGVIVAVIAFVAGYIVRKSSAEKAIGSAEQQAKNIVLDAESKSETIKKEIEIEAKEEAHRMRSEVEKEVRDRRSEVQRQEKRLLQKEESVDRKLESIERKEERIIQKEHQIDEKRAEVDALIDKRVAELEKISGYTADEAKKLLLQEVEKDVRHDASQMIKHTEMCS